MASIAHGLTGKFVKAGSRLSPDTETPLYHDGKLNDCSGRPENQDHPVGLGSPNHKKHTMNIDPYRIVQFYNRHQKQFHMKHLQYFYDYCSTETLLTSKDALSDKQFQIYAKDYPCAALMHAANRLARDPELFSFCIRSNPGYALVFASDFLNEEQLSECSRRAPFDAIKYQTAFLNRVPAIRNECIKKEPAAALGDFEELIMDPHWEYPKYLQYTKSMRHQRSPNGLDLILEEDEFRYCVKHAPSAALNSRNSDPRLNDELFEYSVRKAPKDALRCCWKRLNDEQKAYCVGREARVALCCIGASLPNELLFSAANQDPCAIEIILDHKEDDENFQEFRNNLIQALMANCARLDEPVRAILAGFVARAI